MICPLLAIETSGKSLGVALRAENGLVFEENVQAGSIHGRALAPLITKALQEHRLKPGQLSGVAVSLGPGSWTGLRIGLSAAKALAWGAGIRILGVPSFEALALDAEKHAPQHARLVLRDARSEGFFLALFSETSPHPERWIKECVLKMPDALAAVDEEMSSRAELPLALCGDGVCLDAVAATAQQRGWSLLRQCEHISAAAVAECGWARLLKGEGTSEAAEIHKLGPLYLRASDPEIKLLARQKAGGSGQ
ncbi:MAG TPA: tRNA (adenosine(37)-N6)-threonylcarbamoyltransferase complex dimerization subunit type 1 TsaB [Planctomycetota bacterium]|nr:tRNA (adenosine(37)-N6)-threonylcarbamoyltransferase complex dimerization subunit type 1 TsaB [Planctomycetota bacterium]